MTYHSTPLDALGIPERSRIQVGYRNFASGTIHWRSEPTRPQADALLCWTMNSANVASITINVWEPGSAWPTTTLTMERAHNLAPWTCPGLPNWTPDTGEAVAHEAVVEAMTIIAQHQRAQS